MKISAIRLFNVKRFAGRGVAIEGIGDGVNVLCASNEFGKSTSFEALHALFFQPYSGTPAAVQALRPYSGGNPLVEADIQTAAGRYRITKQFYGGRSARIVDLATDRIVGQADEAERFIADLVRGGTAGPAGLLWVRQGVTGIERRSKAEEDGEKQIRANLLESVRGEIEAITGGRRMSDVIERTENALAQLVTPTLRPKAGERYAATIDERNRLEAEERRLAGEVDALRTALDRRAVAMKRLSELDRAEDRAEQQKALKAAQAEVDAAKSRSEALRASEAELNLLIAHREGAARELAKFRDAMSRLAELKPTVEASERLRTEAVQKRGSAIAAVRTTRAEYEAAERAEQEARALLRRLEGALEARKAAEQLDANERNLAEAEKTRFAIEQGEAALALLCIPEKAVTELEALDIAIAREKAVAEAALPSVTIAYAPEAPVVSMDGTPLEEGKSRSFGGHARMVIPGIGVLTLQANSDAKGDDRLRRKQDERLTLLAKLGIADLVAARERQERARQVEGEQIIRKTRLGMLAPDGLAKLREAVAVQRACLGNTLEVKKDPAAVRAAHENAELRRDAARQALRAAEPDERRAIEAFVAAETAFAGHDAERKQIDATLGPAATRADREKKMAEGLAELDDKIRMQRAAVDPLRSDATDLASAEAKLQRLRSIGEATFTEIGKLREEIAACSAEIRTRSDDAVEEKWRETQDAFRAAVARVLAYEKEVASLQRLRMALVTARSRASDTYLQPVISELRPLLGLLFDDVSITFDEKTLLPHKILRKGQEEDVERLSGGMREQLSVLTRLAFARLLAKDQRPAPVILDDALVYSDDDRIEKMFDALHRQAREQQIIVFSCRQRAFQKLGGNNLHMSEWVPNQQH